MALLEMTVNNQTNVVEGLPVWEATETLTVAGNGNTILLPNNAGFVRDVLVALVISSGSGSIQTTISPLSNVRAGLGNWVTWTAGTVNTTTTATFSNVTAVRAVNASGTIIIEVRAS